MFRDLLSSRWFQGGFAFFLLCVGGSLLYSWHVHRTTEAEFGKRPLAVESMKNKQATNTAPIVFQTEGVTNTPDNNTDTQMPDATEVGTIDETELIDMADAFLPDDFFSKEEVAEEVPVSPFGFGPYPEVPADFPEHLKPIWSRTPNAAEPFELIDRVLIKLWNQGHRDITGGSFSNGKVYPHYANTAYVRYRERTLPDGTVHRSILRIKGGPDISPFAKQIRNGNTPAHIKLIDYNIAGIDPYTFLQ